MKTTVNFSSFVSSFSQIGRLAHSGKPGNFDYAGLRVLFDHLESFEDDIGEELELDVISLCCEYAQEEPPTIASDYNIDLSDCDGDDDVRSAVIDYLENHTTVCGYTPSGEIVYQQF